MATGQDVQPNGHDPPGLPGLGWGNTCASSLPVETASAITMVVSVFIAQLSGSVRGIPSNLGIEAVS
jgi:hypothetical protein